MVDVRLPGKGDSSSHGARPVHLIIMMIKWIRIPACTRPRLAARPAIAPPTLPQTRSPAAIAGLARCRPAWCCEWDVGSECDRVFLLLAPLYDGGGAVPTDSQRSQLTLTHRLEKRNGEDHEEPIGRTADIDPIGRTAETISYHAHVFGQRKNAVGFRESGPAYCHGTGGSSWGVSTTPAGRGIFQTLWFNSVRPETFRDIITVTMHGCRSPTA